MSVIGPFHKPGLQATYHTPYGITQCDQSEVKVIIIPSPSHRK